MERDKLNERKKRIYELISDEQYRPMRAKEIAQLFMVPKARRDDLHAALDSLVEEGKIQLTKQGKYRKARQLRADGPKKLRLRPERGLLIRVKKQSYTETEEIKKQRKPSRAEKPAKPEKPQKRKKSRHGAPLRTGTFLANARGFGFVRMEDEAEDLYIPAAQTCQAMNQDTVEVEISAKPGGRRTEGRVVRIIEHAVTQVVGTFERCSSFGFVLPDDQKILEDIFIPNDKILGAATGDKVVAAITHYGSPQHKPEGEILQVLGHTGDVGIDVLSIAKGHDLPMEFPDRVLSQARKIQDRLSDGDLKGREDLRSWTMVTIDGEDAKDLDDAVSLTREGEDYLLGVHIADVSSYVQEDSALDREAFKRGTSVYLVDRVIPMLPKELSNGICSLNHGCDRLALSCIMKIDREGRIKEHRIVESVICVDERMSYTDVTKILEKTDGEISRQYERLIPMFEQMRDLSAILRRRRADRGAIDFDFPEGKVLLDEMGKPVDVVVHEANVATKLIEDFMLAANETVAKTYCLAEIPFVYRTHEDPDPDKMEQTLTTIRKLGFKVQKLGQHISPAELQKIMEKIEGRPEEPLISRLLLRSMKQACYTTQCEGHFGLAARYYCHFTSPIRRYPDLQIHRIIKESLRGRLDDKRAAHYREILDGVAEHASTTERTAEEVERETIKLKKAEYMAEHIDESFTGVVSGVTGWGMYVELPNTIEGLVHMNQMPDYFVFDEEKMQLVGEHTGKVYAMGQSVSVKVTAADPASRTVDFRLDDGTKVHSEKRK